MWTSQQSAPQQSCFNSLPRLFSCTWLWTHGETVSPDCSRSRLGKHQGALTLKGFQTMEPHHSITICWHICYPVHILHLFPNGTASGTMPHQEPPFSLRQQPCHAPSSDLPMAGMRPTPGANSCSLFQDHLPHRRYHPQSKRDGG